MSAEQGTVRSGPKVAGIVLAAGRSSRMAPRNKLLEVIDGEPMVRRVASVALASGAHPVIAVTGHDSGAVAEALRGLKVRIVHNDCWAEGLSTSLRAGLGALPSECEGALICLGDMPGIEAGVLKDLMTAFAASGRDAICVPVRSGRRGNPVLWGKAFFVEMLTIEGDAGAKHLIERHEHDVVEVEVATDSIFVDVDAPSDLRRFKLGAIS